ncbi:uncharacterized mitochondrial protein-like protein, partial [Tanacetum coccineum]
YILITRNSLSFINHIKDKLHKEFSIKNLGQLSYYLGIEFLRSSKGIVMTQRKYALDLIEQAGLTNTKHAKTPLDQNVKLTFEARDLLPDPSIYKALVGKLIYLTISRPDVAFAAQVLSQFSHNPYTTHMEALKRLNLLAFKEAVVSRSSTEAEYRALAYCTCEITWLNSLLPDLHIPTTKPVMIFCDNTSAIALASNPVQHGMTKHIEIDCHFVRDKIKTGHILPTYIPSTSQTADILTKALETYPYHKCLSKLGMCDPYTLPTCRRDMKVNTTSSSKVNFVMKVNTISPYCTRHQKYLCKFS